MEGAGARRASIESKGGALAPVAGEAVLRIYAEGSTRTVTEWLDGARDLPDGDYKLYAAPRASAEDVRNAALEEAAAALEDHRRAGREWVPGSLWDTLSREAAARIRALKQPQAGNDSGQQRAEDAERWRWATATDENAQGLYTIVQCYGGDQKKINERADFYRAALSATQAGQGERDA